MTILRQLKEQTVTPEKLRKQERLKIDIGGEPHDPTSPNKSHIEEEQLDEVPVSVPIGHNRRRAKKTSFAYTSLGGKDQKSRASAQRQGNQKMANRYEEVDNKSKCSMYAEEATKKVMKKLKEKKGEQPAGKTSTGQPGDIVDTAPTKPELTGYH
jgi:hypothetical protein